MHLLLVLSVIVIITRGGHEIAREWRALARFSSLHPIQVLRHFLRNFEMQILLGLE